MKAKAEYSILVNWIVNIVVVGFNPQLSYCASSDKSQSSLLHVVCCRLVRDCLYFDSIVSVNISHKFRQVLCRIKVLRICFFWVWKIVRIFLQYLFKKKLMKIHLWNVISKKHLCTHFSRAHFRKARGCHFRIFIEVNAVKQFIDKHVIFIQSSRKCRDHLLGIYFISLHRMLNFNIFVRSVTLLHYFSIIKPYWMRISRHCYSKAFWWWWRFWKIVYMVNFFKLKVRSFASMSDETEVFVNFIAEFKCICFEKNYSWRWIQYCSCKPET